MKSKGQSMCEDVSIMGSKGLGLMVTLQLCKQNQDRILDRNSSEQPLHIKRHHDLVVLNDLTRDVEDEMQ